jgi:hypothetical protein
MMQRFGVTFKEHTNQDGLMFDACSKNEVYHKLYEMGFDVENDVEDVELFD